MKDLEMASAFTISSKSKRQTPFGRAIGDILCAVADWIVKIRKTEKIVITRTAEKKKYLSRWFLFGKSVDSSFAGGRAVMLHKFHESDADEMHDHPWPFISIILTGGYWEKTPRKGWSKESPDDSETVMLWHGPGSILRNKASRIHSVVIEEGSEPVTLILRGKKSGSWGFYCPKFGFMDWRKHLLNVNSGKAGCG